MKHETRKDNEKNLSSPFFRSSGLRHKVYRKGKENSSIREFQHSGFPQGIQTLNIRIHICFYRHEESQEFDSKYTEYTEYTRYYHCRFTGP